MFERLIFKYVFNHFKDNDILSAFQSGFKPGDSSINQLTYLYNSFCKAIDAGKEIRVVFFDISKAFDRVWHKGLLVKLNATGLPQDLVNLLGNYLSGRYQRVVVPGTKSSWKQIRAGVPQGSILGPLLFLLYVNDIVSNIQSNIRLFADDTSLFLIIDKDSDVASSALTLNQDISTVMEWAERWLVSFNPVKTESLLISRKRNPPIHPDLSMAGQSIPTVPSHKHLGVFLSSDCS